ncbi:MAG: hypothetical protein V1492_02200 [Candidatus Micrarchaeota archaeon]
MVKQNVKNEGPRDRFKRLAVKRANKVLEALRVFGHCSNRQIYEYDGDDVKKLFSVIDKELRRVKNQFEKPAALSIELK